MSDSKRWLRTSAYAASSTNNKFVAKGQLFLGFSSKIQSQLLIFDIWSALEEDISRLTESKVVSQAINFW